MTVAEKILSFYQQLSIPGKLPKSVEILNPYHDKHAFQLCTAFYSKFYNDHNSRKVILGINPGRFGGGITGIPFTDPIKLEHVCGIPNDMPRKVELSADYIYKMIDAFGGPQVFYGQYFFSSVSPLGFTMEGKNMNYYDTPELLKSVENFILKSIRQILEMGMQRDVAFCLGEGDNFKYLTKLNKQESFFKEIIPLAHPRFIMQYKRKMIDRYIEDYLRKLGSH